MHVSAHRPGGVSSRSVHTTSHLPGGKEVLSRSAYTTSHLPGGEVEKFVDAQRREFFGWGESWGRLRRAAPFAPPEKCFASAQHFSTSPPERWADLCMPWTRSEGWRGRCEAVHGKDNDVTDMPVTEKEQDGSRTTTGKQHGDATAHLGVQSRFPGRAATPPNRSRPGDARPRGAPSLLRPVPTPSAVTSGFFSPIQFYKDLFRCIILCFWSQKTHGP